MLWPHLFEDFRSWFSFAVCGWVHRPSFIMEKMFISGPKIENSEIENLGGQHRRTGTATGNPIFKNNDKILKLRNRLP